MNSKISNKRVIMFGGKGGVGKTTCAGATAMYYAGCGMKTLVISTDPAPSLSDIFEVNETKKPVKINDNLHLAELGLNEVREMWDRKFGREVYEVFSSIVSIGYEEFVEFITSILPGLTEEFMVDHIRELFSNGKYDKIVWDTAPLGQTIHLLNMPEMLVDHLKPAPRIYSRLKIGGISKKSILKILEDWTKLSNEDMEFLHKEVDFTLVTIPEALAVNQLEGIQKEFSLHGFKFTKLIINNVITVTDSDFLSNKRQQQQRYLDQITTICDGMEITLIPLFPYEIMGQKRVEEISNIICA